MITHFDIDIYAYRVHVLHNVTDAQFNKYFADTFRCEVERTNYGASVWQMENKSGRKESIIDFAAGMILHRKVGDCVQIGQAIATMYASDESLFEAADRKYQEAVTIGATQPKTEPLILARVTKERVDQYGE